MQRNSQFTECVVASVCENTQQLKTDVIIHTTDHKLLNKDKPTDSWFSKSTDMPPMANSSLLKCQQRPIPDIPCELCKIVSRGALNEKTSKNKTNLHISGISNWRSLFTPHKRNQNVASSLARYLSSHFAQLPPLSSYTVFICRRTQQHLSPKRTATKRTLHCPKRARYQNNTE